MGHSRPSSFADLPPHGGRVGGGRLPPTFRRRCLAAPARVGVAGPAVADLTVIDGQLAYHDLRFPLAPGSEGGTPQQVHERQHYRLTDWRRANSELNYRRFFDVATLAAVRVEDPVVFRATHEMVLRWVADGLVTGLRVDHPDGLADPGAYVRRL